MQIAVYVWVSTHRQMQQKTIDQQSERLRAHIQAQGWEFSNEHISWDDGCSGADLTRSGLERLRDVAMTAVLDRVLISSPDRLARECDACIKLSGCGSRD